jgi:adenylate cyclase
MLGVLGADIEIEALGDFLKCLSIGHNGIALIFDKQGRLVAYHQANRVVKRIGDTRQTAMLNEIIDPVLSRATPQLPRIADDNGQLEQAGDEPLNREVRTYLQTIQTP